MAEASRKTQAERYAIQQYRKGRLPAQIIPEIAEKYGYTESTAFDRAYDAWKRFKQSLAHMLEQDTSHKHTSKQKRHGTQLHLNGFRCIISSQQIIYQNNGV